MITKKIEAKIKSYLKATPVSDRASGQVLSGTVSPGPFRFLALAASIQRIQSLVQVNLVGSIFTMYSAESVGVLAWLLPVNGRTEESTVKLLVALGWDGRAWPLEPGWPDDSPIDKQGLEIILRGERLGATLTFPPDPVVGSTVLPIHILKASVPFPLPPVVPEADQRPVTQAHVDRLRVLAGDASAFVSTKSALKGRYNLAELSNKLPD